MNINEAEERNIEAERSVAISKNINWRKIPAVSILTAKSFISWEKKGSGTKLMVWQHNEHISNPPEIKSLGYNLHQCSVINTIVLL